MLKEGQQVLVPAVALLRVRVANGCAVLAAVAGRHVRRMLGTVLGGHLGRHEKIT